MCATDARCLYINRAGQLWELNLTEVMQISDYRVGYDFVSISSVSSIVVIANEKRVLTRPDRNSGWVLANDFRARSVAAYENGYYALLFTVPEKLTKYISALESTYLINNVIPQNKTALAIVAAEKGELLILLFDHHQSINSVMTYIDNMEGPRQYELNEYDLNGESVKQIAISQRSPPSFAVVTDQGSVYTWGQNTIKGNLGHAAERWFPEPTKVEGIDDAVAIGISESHLVVVREDGSLWSPNPYWVTVLSEINDARAVYCGNQLTMILHQDERVSVCGWIPLNGGDIPGHGLFTNRPIDVEVLPKIPPPPPDE
jgi:TusA-related sulfurtransferase